MAGRSKNIADKDVFLKVLKDKGLKATAQRLAVHEAMVNLVHASADMVCRYISENLYLNASVTSVYNILTQFAREGIYASRLSADNKMFFDIVSGKHVHLYDCVNHTFRDLPDDEVIKLVENHFKRRRFKGFKMDYIEVQIVCHPTGKKKS